MTSRIAQETSLPHADANRGVDDRAQGWRGSSKARSVLRFLSLAVLAFACDAPSKAPAVPVMPTQPVAPPQQPLAEDAEPAELGQFSVTLYYVAEESAVSKGRGVATPDGEAEIGLAAIDTSDRVTLFSGPTCEPIVDVSREFAAQLTLQGTGKLRDGRVLNVSSRCGCDYSPCFKVTANQWGTAGTGRALNPFRTVAVDPKLVKLGSLLYIPLLDGRTMPGRPPWGGFVHDGCVVADDTGGGIKGNQIDLFVGRKAHYHSLARAGSGSPGRHSWASKIPVFDGSKLCERSGRRVGRKAASI
ncbi:MAG: 3D domain-containing protein [Kofleriaceae bacterium]